MAGCQQMLRDTFWFSAPALAWAPCAALSFGSKYPSVQSDIPEQQ